ncbi:MAG: helix-turn-helix transcriptional regulator [Cyanobacteriota bacterium]|nr:helix-turn-helix transcriptional regulator [Cyanobacteriota bacterium]
MGKAGTVLKQVLETYGITQNRLAVTMGTRRSNVGRWFHGQVDPTGDTIVEIVAALRQLEPNAAQEFVRQYLGEVLEGGIEDDSDSSIE